MLPTFSWKSRLHRPRRCNLGPGSMHRLRIYSTCWTAYFVVNWMWDETHQLLMQSVQSDVFSHLPLTTEYISALRSGSAMVSRNVAMSIMVHLGGLMLVDSKTDTVLVLEACNVPQVRLQRLTADCLQTALQVCMPMCPTQPCALQNLCMASFF